MTTTAMVANENWRINLMVCVIRDEMLTERATGIRLDAIK